jgi:hypothetical protein
MDNKKAPLQGLDRRVAGKGFPMDWMHTIQYTIGSKTGYKTEISILNSLRLI